MEAPEWVAILLDEEGKQTMRVLARNMVFMMKSFALGKEKFGLPEKEEHVWTVWIKIPSGLV